MNRQAPDGPAGGAAAPGEGGTGGGAEGPPASDAFRIDREGAWWHHGVEVTHEGVLRGLWASLDFEDGRHVLRAGPVRLPVRVDDAPYVVVRLDPAVAEHPGAFLAHLCDGSREMLDAGTVVLGAGGVPYCRVRDGRFRARLSVAAWLQLATRLHEGPGPGEMTLVLGDRRVVIAGAPPRDPAST